MRVIMKSSDMYLLYEEENVWHVFPTKEEKHHVLKGLICGCNPKIEVQPNKALIVIHKMCTWYGMGDPITP